MSKFVLTAQLQLQAPNNVKQVVQQIQSQLNGVSVNIQVQNAGQAQKQIQQVAQATNQATSAAERMGKAFALSIRRFAAFSIATRAVGLFTSTLSDAVQTSIDFERQLIKVSQVTGKSLTQLRGLTKQITDLSTGFGVASSDLLNVSTILAQAGLSAEDTAIALKTLAKSALAPNFDSITETAEGAIAVLAQFQEGVGALEKQLGSINAVAGAFAVEASDLIDVIRRTGGVFKASGGDLNELLALFTSVRATTRESAESIGTGLRTIFTRIQRPKTIEFLKQFGVELVDLDGKFVGPYEAIKRLSEALSGLGEGDISFIRIAEELGGFRQIGKVLPLLQQFSTAQSALNVAMKAGDSLTQDAASAQAALAVRIMKVKEEFLALIRSITETSTFQVMANTALSLASALIKIGDSIKPLLPLLAGLAAFKLAKGMGSFFGGMMSGAASGRAYNKGGKVLGFARGGLVPGSGNRDTVPAMLSPGEFVIRKSSVNKMGAGTLAAMNNNRYAMGGTVGAIALNPLGSQSTGKGTVTVKDILATLSNNNQLAGGISGNIKLTDKKGKLQNLMDRKEAPDGLTFGNRLEKLVSRIAFGGKNQQTFTTKGVAFPSTKNSDSSVEQGIKTALTNAYTNIIPGVASQLASSVGLPTAIGAFNQNVIKSIGLEDATGKIFEAAVSSLGAPFDANRGKQDRDAFDFPMGIGNHLGQFKAFSELANNPTDAKKSLDSSILNDIASRKTMNTLAEQVNTNGAFQALKKRVLSMEGTSKGRSEFDNPRGPRKKFFGGLIQRFAEGGEVLERGTQKYLISDVVKGIRELQGNPALSQKDAIDLFNSKDARGDFIYSNFGGPGSIKLPKWMGTYRPQSAAYGAFQKAQADKQNRISSAMSRQGKTMRDYETRREFATGGGVGTDTVPALLTPGEFVVNRSSAQRIGYGSLNRMNKVGKYASGGIVQRFAGGSSGSGVKPSAGPSYGDVTAVSPGGIMGQIATEEAKLLEERRRVERDNIKAIAKVYKDSYEDIKRSTKDAVDAAKAFGMSQKEINDIINRSKNEVKQLKEDAIGQARANREATDAQRPAIREQAKKNVLDARQNSPDMLFKRAKDTAKAGSFNVGDFGVSNFDKLTQAQQKQIYALQKASVESSKAAAADNAEATASKNAASADNAQSKGGGAGGMMGGNKMMAASMATGIISSFLPAVDESSSAMLKVTHSLMGLVTTVTTVGFALEAFGVTLNAQNLGNIGKFLTGNVGKIGVSGTIANTAASYARAGTSAVGRGIQTAAGGLASKGGMAGSVGKGIVNFGSGIQNLGPTLGKFAGNLTRLAGPMALATGGVYAFSSIVDGFTQYQSKYNKAVEEGNSVMADKMAFEKAGADAVNSLALGVAAAGAAFGPLGALAGGIAGGLIKLGSELPVVGKYVKSFAIGVGAAFGGKNEAAVSAFAKAQVEAAKTQKALTESEKSATQAMKDFEEGRITAGSAVASTSGAGDQIMKERQAAMEAAKLNSDRKGGSVVRDMFSMGTFGMVDSSETRNKKIDEENKAMMTGNKKNQEKLIQQSTPAVNALSRQFALAGGTFEDVMADIKKNNPALYFSLINQGTTDLQRNFDNISKEVGKAKKAFEALNLGLRAPAATAIAASSALSNFTANLEVGSNPVEQSVSMIEASFSEAGQAMDPNDIKAAIGNVASTLEEFGASGESVTKFKENAEAFAAVSANYNQIFEGVKDDFSSAELKGLNAEGFNDKFASNLDEQLKNAGIGEEVRQRMKDVVGDIKLSDDDMKKLRTGDFSVYQKYLDEAGQKTVEEAKKIAAETGKINQQLISLTKQRIESERNLVQAQQEALDLSMEGREIQGKYGGRAVTGQERKDNLLAKSNVEGNRLGLSAMRAGDVGDLRRRNAEIRSKFAGIESQRTAEGGLQKTAGVEADAAQQDLQKAYKTQIETIRGLIKLEEEQLKITQEKNKLEKDSMESLIKGDVEEFFKKQSAVGATAAIASGDTRLQNLYGADALGMAAQDIQRQQEAGVQSLYGQQLAGPGGLTEAAAGAALSSRGITDMRSAQVMAGTTAEEEASKARLRELGGMLGETGQLGTEMAEMQVQTATVNINTANLKLEEIKERGRRAASEAETIENRPAVAKARGGLIYANRGIFVPRGTDTIPAMLTPGEFVVNRGAVQRGNNLQILRAMNNGSGGVSSDGGTALMARGGMVRYRGDGSDNAEAPASGGGGMFENMSKFVMAISNFNTDLSKNIDKLTNNKITIRLDATSVNVNLNDGGLLSALTKEVQTVILSLIPQSFKVVEGGRIKQDSGVK